MRVKLILLLLLFPIGMYSQTKKVAILKENLEKQWITLANDWHYQKGDNLEWAKTDYDDSQWKTFSSSNLNMPDSTAVIADDNEIAWFRKYIKIDSLYGDGYTLQVIQQGASEIYLDGKLIHKLGTVGTHPDDIVNNNPNGMFLPLPLEQGKEHVLAVRYVNGQYKYPENRRIANTNGFIRLFATTKNFANKTRVFTITDSTLVSNWSSLSAYWRFKKGDDSNWAQPNYDDSSWTQFTSPNLNKPDSKSITNKNEIVWFRKPIKADSTLNDALVLRVYVINGASEIYLDGELLHTIGKVSSNPEEAKKHNPYKTILSLPLVKNKEQVLAVRFINYRQDFPFYGEQSSNTFMQVTSLTNLLTNGPELSFVEDKDFKINKNNNYIVLGIGLFMFILFLSYYAFFPAEKINAYFALASLFFSLFLVSVILDSQIPGISFTIQLLILITSVVYTLLLLFCIYKIFNRRLGGFFWSVVTINVLSILIAFLFDPTFFAPIVAIFLIFDIIRICLKSYKTNKTGALIFITISSLTMLYWVIALAINFFNIENMAFLENYMAIAFSLLPIGIAIYLGFAFGKRSQSLRLNLERVHKLSKEKESILAKQNETLETQVKERTASLNQSLENLKATQSQLIQSEKMASLGELTAGIAHEIQNPLNFVNNFAEVSNELVDEMNEELNKGDIEEAKAISEDIKQNLEKITHHGKRADGIVKGMLQHSRTGTGKTEPTDINKLTDEYFRLAYHGLRAKDKSFNATLETNCDDTIGKINVVPQDIGRVILNLFTNAFYAVDEKKKQEGNSNFSPKVSVSTKLNKNNVEISVKDNGNGIPKKVLDKIFQPFFTTKPTGQGTGLGLSMSYDIITKGHGGELKVETQEGTGTTFSISLPIKPS